MGLVGIISWAFTKSLLAVRSAGRTPTLPLCRWEAGAGDLQCHTAGEQAADFQNKALRVEGVY